MLTESKKCYSTYAQRQENPLTTHHKFIDFVQNNEKKSLANGDTADMKTDCHGDRRKTDKERLWSLRCQQFNSKLN